MTQNPSQSGSLLYLCSISAALVHMQDFSMASPVDSAGLPGSHRSAGATPLASPAGAEEAADQRVLAVLAYERAQHVSSVAFGLLLSSLTALTAIHYTYSLQRHDQYKSSGSCGICCMAALCQTASDCNRLLLAKLACLSCLHSLNFPLGS